MTATPAVAADMMGDVVVVDTAYETYGKVNGGMDEPFEFDNQLHTLKVGINYQFRWSQSSGETRPRGRASFFRDRRGMIDAVCRG